MRVEMEGRRAEGTEEELKDAGVKRVLYGQREEGKINSLS